MNRCHDDEYDDDDEMLNDSISEDEPDDMSLESDELRSARIEEYKHARLRHEDPLRANLGAVTAGLLEIASQHETAVKNALRSAAGNILESPNVQRAISMHLNITRQVDRYANLELRLDERQRQAETRTQRRMTALPAAPHRHGRI